MYDELLKQWANEQGFQTWSQDHAAVLRNLTSWLNQHAAQHSVQLTGLCACKIFIPSAHSTALVCRNCGKPPRN